jgi:DnaK suppressor protein
MKPEKIFQFKTNLIQQRNELLLVQKQTTDTELKDRKDSSADEADLSSTTLAQSLTLRLRGREALLIKKIDHALERIKNGNFGECTSCGNEIEMPRLEARPITTFCLSCKEEQERSEKSFVKKRKSGNARMAF